MTISEVQIRSQHLNKIGLNFLALNGILVISVFLIVEVETWGSRLIMVAALLGGAFLIKALSKKALNKQKLLLKEVEALHGHEAILCSAKMYLGAPYSNNVSHLLSIPFYAVILICAVLFAYSIVMDDIITMVILGVVHCLLAIPIIISLPKMLSEAAVLTKGHLLLVPSTVIDLTKIKKYQLTPLLNGDVVLEINTGDYFTRLIIEEKDSMLVKQLLIDSTVVN